MVFEYMLFDGKSELVSKSKYDISLIGSMKETMNDATTIGKSITFSDIKRIVCVMLSQAKTKSRAPAFSS